MKGGLGLAAFLVWLIVVAFVFSVAYGSIHRSPAPWEPCDAPLHQTGCGR